MPESAIFSAMSQAILNYRSSGALQGERLLQVCIVGSVVLHALTMLYAPKVETKAPPPVRFSATIRAAAAPAAPAPVSVATPEPVVQMPETPPPPPVATPAPPVPVPKPIAEKALSKSAAPAPTPAPAPTTPASAAPPAETKSAAAASEAKDAPKAAAAAAPAAPSNDPSDKDMINGYQAQLAQVAGKYKRYPNDAMQNQWEGVALITLRIGVDGRIMGAPEITTSSGHEILDNEARTTINKAKPFVQIPPGLKGKEFVAQVRVVFSLKN